MDMTEQGAKILYKKNKLGQLKAFIKAFELGSISKAAKELSISQPSVSVQIQSLEEFLECELFIRSGAKIYPTDKARILYDITAKHVIGIDEILKNFKNIPTVVTDRVVKIAAHHIFTTRVIGKYLKNLDPKTKIHILDVSRDQALEMLEQNEIDIAIYPMYDLPPALKNTKIDTYKPLLVVHKSNPLAEKDYLTPADIATQSLVRVNAKYIILPIFNDICKQYNWTSNITFDSPDWAVLMQLVRNNLGVALVSGICLEDDKDVVFKDLSHIFPEINYYLAVNEFSFASKTVVDVVRVFDKKFAENLNNAPGE